MSIPLIRMQGYIHIPSVDLHLLTMCQPYLDKADRIGYTHNFGDFVLGDILVPPGWREGDAPINELHARKLYNEARADSQSALFHKKDQSLLLHGLQKEAADQEVRDAWNRDYALDLYILKLRVEIYSEYLDRQREKAYTKSARMVQTGTSIADYRKP